MTGRLLGVDYGQKRVGLAVCDVDQNVASPLITIERTTAAEDAKTFRKIVAEENIVEIIVGLPIHTDGREGVKSHEARRYGDWLRESTGLPVRFWDERFTTVHAESALWQSGLTHSKRKARRDRVAAQMMLQSFLEAGCPTDEGVQPLATDPSTIPPQRA